MKTRRLASMFSVLLLMSTAAAAATYPELSERTARRPVANYGNRGAIPGPGYGMQPSYGSSSAMPMLPSAGNGTPDDRQVRWSYGQVNAASDPFYIWGLRTQGMYVPWSTPMSSWTNAQSWDWWRRRAGDSGPPPPLW